MGRDTELRIPLGWRQVKFQACISWMTHSQQTKLALLWKPEGDHLLGKAWMIKPGSDSKAMSYGDMAWL